MLLTIFGDSDKVRLDNVARSVYTLLPEEYKITELEDRPGEYGIEVSTLRRFDPIIRATISQSTDSATLSLYTPINSDKELTYEMIMEALQERYKISSLYIRKDAVLETLEIYNKGLIVEDHMCAFAVPVVNGKDALIQIFFEAKSHKPKLLPDGKVDYKSFTKFINVKENELLIKRTPPTPGERGYAVTGGDILPVPGKDIIIDALDGVTLDDNKTEYRAKHNGHVIFSGNVISVLPLLTVNGTLDFHTGNIQFDGTVYVTKDTLAGFSIAADDIIIDGIDEDSILTAKQSVIIKTGIKGLGSKGFIKAGSDVVTGYSENARITAKGSIEIKKYCFNSVLAADTIFASAKESIITGGYIKAFARIHAHNLGAKGTNDMTVEVGVSPDLDDKAKRIKAEINQLTESLIKITEVLSKVDLTNPLVVRNPKVRKLLETASLLKRRLPLLETKLGDTSKKSIHPDPRIVVEGTVRAGVKIKFFGSQIEVRTDMSKIEFFFKTDSNEISFKPFVEQK